MEAFAEVEAEEERGSPGKPYPDILRAVYGRIAKKCGVAATAEERDALAHSIGDWPPFAESARALARLKRRYRLAVLSNVDRASFHKSELALGVRFDLVVMAEDVGAFKPDQRNFIYLIEKLEGKGTKKAEVLHVAQSLYHDIVPARKLGLATAWVDRRRGSRGHGATLPPAEEAVPDLVVADLGELADLLGCAE